jgi:hypothetical protein
VCNDLLDSSGVRGYSDNDNDNTGVLSRLNFTVDITLIAIVRVRKASG